MEHSSDLPSNGTPHISFSAVPEKLQIILFSKDEQVLRNYHLSWMFRQVEWTLLAIEEPMIDLFETSGGGACRGAVESKPETNNRSEPLGEHPNGREMSKKLNNLFDTKKGFDGAR